MEKRLEELRKELFLADMDKPFFLEGSNDVLVLLFHGFNGRPGEMMPPAKALNQRGYSVKGILQPAHCGSFVEFKRTTWKDIVDNAQLEYMQAKEKYRRVIIGGLSMGGLTSLYLAATNQDLDALISMSAPVALNTQRLRMLLRSIGLFSSKYPSLSFGLDIADRDVRRLYGSYYPYESVSFALSLLDFIDTLKGLLPRITAPACILHGKRDLFWAPDSLDYIFNNISSKIKQKHQLPLSRHVITLDLERERVCSIMVDFVDRIAS